MCQLQNAPWKCACIWLLLWLGLTARTLAIDPDRTADQYQYSQWTTKDGIPYTAVRRLFQSSDGFLWLCTRGGAARFDGVTFTPYTRAEVPVMADDEIWTIAEDSEGVLWFGTSQGILWQKNGRWWRPDCLKDYEKMMIRWIEREGDEMYFASTTGIFHFKQGHAGPVALPGEVSFKDLRTVSRTADKGWIIAANPAWWVKGDTALVLKDEAHTRLQEVWAVQIMPDGRWLIGAETGLYHFAQDHAEKIQKIGGLSVQTVRSLLLDRDKTLWVGMRGDLLRVVGNTASVMERTGSDSITNFLHLLEDKEGALWGGNDSGLVRLGDVKAVNIGREEGLGARSVVAVLTAHSGKIWVGVWGGGLTRMSATGVVEETYREGALVSDAVWNLAEGPDGTLWLGYYNRGIGSLKDGTFTSYPGPAELGSRKRDMKADQEGTLWISTWEKGLFHLRNGVFKPLIIDGIEITNALLVDKQGRLWVSWDKGFGRVDTHTGQWLEKYERDKEPPHEATAMLESDDGDIWVLRNETRIDRLHQGRLQHFNLPSWVGKATYSAVSHSKELSISYRNGIVRIPFAEFDALAAGNKTEADFSFYNEIDGLRGLAPNIFGGQGASVGNDGSLYFATSKGLAVIKPSRVRKVEDPPSVVIDQVIIDKTVLHPQALGKLNPGRGEVEFRFTALGLGNATQNKFRHRLIPIEKDWVDAGSSRVAYYGGLPPGKYRFEVIAANADRVWNEIGARCEFELPRHFYQSWLFYLGVALLLGFLTLLYIRWHEAGLLKEKELLEQGVAARTRELHEANQQLQDQVAQTAQKASQLQASEERFRHLTEDLEERVKLRTAQLLSANAELEAFAYSVSHDLRTPLRGIDGWSFALLEDYGPSLDEKGRRYLDRVRSETKRLGTLIDDLLKFSRMTSNELNMKPLDLSELVKTTAQRVTELRPERPVAFSCVGGILCQGDKALLEAALFNLLDNAWKFTGKTENPTVEFGSTEHEGHRVLFLRDNGAGFDMRHAQKLFGAFQRMHSQTEFPGTGIGLATVQKIIRRHGGDIWAESKPGVQTTFYFTLPLLSGADEGPKSS